MRILLHLCALLLFLGTSFSFSVNDGGTVGVTNEPMVQGEGSNVPDNSGVDNSGAIDVSNGSMWQGNGMIMPISNSEVVNNGAIGVSNEPMIQSEGMFMPADNSEIVGGDVIGVSNVPIVQGGEVSVPIYGSELNNGGIGNVPNVPMAQGDVVAPANNFDVGGEVATESTQISDKKHIHSYVDQLLGTGDVNSVDPEKLSEASVTMQVHNLQKNMEALQFSLSKFEESQKSKKSKANVLYTKIKSAFTEYFNGELPDSEKKAESQKLAVDSAEVRKQKSANLKGEKIHSELRASAHSKDLKNFHSVSTWKRLNYSGNYPTKSYGNIPRQNFPTKSYGTVKKISYPTKSYTEKAPTKLSVFPTKSYGKKNIQPTRRYTVKTSYKQYFKKKGCCGKDE